MTTSLGATEATLLGLIGQAEGDGPVHGYDLQRQLAESTLGHVIRIEPGMLYHYLKKLARRGLVTADVAVQDGRPARHLHTLTVEGRTALDAWLAEPVASTREIRLEFLLKLWFARQRPDAAAALVRAQLAMIDRHIASLEAQIAALDDADRFGADVLGLRLGQNRTIRDWLATLEDLA